MSTPIEAWEVIAVPRHGYRTITLREDIYRKLKLLAASRGCSIQGLIEEFVEGKEHELKVMKIDYTKDLGLKLGTSACSEKIKVELDETDHIIFICPLCGAELIIWSMDVEPYPYGTVRLRFICPKCKTQYFRKFYASGSLTYAERIPKVLVDLLKPDMAGILEDITKAIIGSIGLDNYHVLLDKSTGKIFVHKEILHSPAVAIVCYDYCVGENFFAKYYELTGRKDVEVTEDYLVFDLKFFARAFRGVIKDIVENLKPNKVLEDGTELYVFRTNFETEPAKLLPFIYGGMVNDIGFMLRKIDVLRSAWILIWRDFDGLGCVDFVINVVKRGKTFQDIIDKLKPKMSKLSFHGDELLKLWSLSGTILVSKRKELEENIVIAFSHQ